MSASKSKSAQRQARKAARDARRGITRTSVRVHAGNLNALRAIERRLEKPNAGEELVKALAELRIEAPNVSKVQHVSPFRYPGGKTWLVPTVKAWLSQLESPTDRFIEPFAGGASVSLAIAHAGLAPSVLLVEMDPIVASVWRVLLGRSQAQFETLCKRVRSFNMTEATVRATLAAEPASLGDQAFATIVANRARRGGILAPGASIMKNGEGGKGIASRWYPETLIRRFEIVRSLRRIVSIEQGDAFEVFDRYREDRSVCWFVDPPYTAGGKRAGARLYNLHSLDHARLFRSMSRCAGPVMATYDAAPEVLEMAELSGFAIHDARMRNTHNTVTREVVLLKPDVTLA